MIIRELKAYDEEAFVAAYREFEYSQDFNFVSYYKEGMAFDELLSVLSRQELGIDLKEGYVPSTFLFAFVQKKLVGRLMVRHKLNTFLRRIGGHIGYGVVPSERGKGYGKAIAQHSLTIAKTLGLQKVLISCDEENLPSKKIIEELGGVLERVEEQEGKLPKKRLYWVEITDER